MTMLRPCCFILAGLMIVLGSCSTREPVQNAEVKQQPKPKPISFDSLTDRYYEDFVVLNPLNAMFFGDHRFNHTFPNTLTAEYRDQLREFHTRYKDALARVDRNALMPEQQISYDILAHESRINLDKLDYRFELLPMHQAGSTPQVMGMLATGESAQPFNTVGDYDNWLMRLKGFRVWCDSAAANMKTGIKSHIVLPKSLTVKLIPQIETLGRGPVDKNIFCIPLKRMPKSFTRDERARLAKELKTFVGDSLMPSIQNLVTFLKGEYLERSSKSAGVYQYPQGISMYQHLIETYTTTGITADEVFLLGQQEVDRIRVEMEKVKKQIGSKNSLKLFLKQLRSNPKLTPYRKPGQVLDNFRKIQARMEPHIPKLFEHVPVTKFEVHRTERFREASASPEYYPGSSDGSRPGIFYVPVPDVRKYNILRDESLFLHEAIPGHHFQVSLQFENENIPKFRRLLMYAAYAEGWGLYAESLGHELGLYKNLYQYFGALNQEMHRAIRLVVDAGIHAKGWSREQAIRYSLANEAEPEADVIREIERYMALPGQALSYKVGQLKIRELRTRAESTLGAAFDIREFHRKVLESGSLPLSVLENKINEWVDLKKKNQGV